MGKNFVSINQQEYEVAALSLASLSIDMVEQAQSGHPGMPMGMADIMAVLALKYLNIYSADLAWIRRDRLVLSNGHGSALLYATLHLLGAADFSLEELQNFRQMGAKTHGHPEFSNYNGVETTTGPLAQGFGNAVGMAITQKKLQALYPSHDLDYKVVCFVGDGCLMEGLSSEAASLAGHLQLNNLIVIYDSNQISIDGSTSLSFSEDVMQRFSAQKWQVLEISGHDYKEIDNALTQAFAQPRTSPLLIKANTKIAYRSPSMEGKVQTHGAPLGKQEIASFKNNNGLPLEPFTITDAASQIWHKARDRQKKVWATWKMKNGDFKLTLEIEEEKKRIMDKLSVFIAGIKPDIKISGVATRVSSKHVLEKILPAHFLTLGSADLMESNGMKIEGYQPINSTNFLGNTMHFGVREHAMAAVANGIALSGFMPIIGTFLVFSDYMRPSIRLAAMMKLPIIYIMTHDSIGLGEDGPTHQPVEHLNSLRLIPNLHVLRPCDLAEVAVAYQLALETAEPTVIALSRQSLPQVIEGLNVEEYYHYGAKVIKHLQPDKPKRKIVILASGSEVEIALELAYNYSINDVEAVVVSVLDLEKLCVKGQSWLAQLRKGATIMVALEAGTKGLWAELLEKEDRFYGVKTFGQSGPGPQVYKHFKLQERDIWNDLRPLFF